MGRIGGSFFRQTTISAVQNQLPRSRSDAHDTHVILCMVILRTLSSKSGTHTAVRKRAMLSM